MGISDISVSLILLKINKIFYHWKTKGIEFLFELIYKI